MMTDYEIIKAAAARLTKPNHLAEIDRLSPETARALADGIDILTRTLESCKIKINNRAAQAEREKYKKCFIGGIRHYKANPLIYDNIHNGLNTDALKRKYPQEKHVSEWVDYMKTIGYPVDYVKDFEVEHKAR